MDNPVQIVRQEEMERVVKLSFLARILIKLYHATGEYLYKNGFISDLADVDRMTGLFNKNFFDQWAPKVLSQARRSETVLSFVYIDVNDLKKINDSLGHAYGDKMLKTFAKTLLHSLRSSDLVFRLGGDEFAVILWNCSKEWAIEKILKIRGELDKKGVEFSFGVVEDDGKKTIEMIMRGADTLMYEMKKKMKRKEA